MKLLKFFTFEARCDRAKRAQPEAYKTAFRLSYSDVSNDLSGYGSSPTALDIACHDMMSHAEDLEEGVYRASSRLFLSRKLIASMLGRHDGMVEAVHHRTSYRASSYSD